MTARSASAYLAHAAARARQPAESLADCGPEPTLAARSRSTSAPGEIGWARSAAAAQSR